MPKTKKPANAVEPILDEINYQNNSDDFIRKVRVCGCGKLIDRKTGQEVHLSGNNTHAVKHWCRLRYKKSRTPRLFRRIYRVFKPRKKRRYYHG